MCTTRLIAVRRTLHRLTSPCYLPSSQARCADACVDDALAEAWGVALQTNCTLERLNLESNAVGTRGVRALAAALRVNRSLRELKICNQRVRYTPLDAGYTPAATPLRCSCTPQTQLHLLASATPLS